MAKAKPQSEEIALAHNDTHQHDELIAKFKAARRAATPIVAIGTADAATTIRTICGCIIDDVAKFQWDVCRGLAPINEAATLQAEKVQQIECGPILETDLIKTCPHFEQRTIIFVHNAHKFLDGNDLESKIFMQGIWNLRDDFKANKRTIVLLAPSIKLPVELQNDTIVIDDALPNRARLQKIVEKSYQNAQISVEADKLTRAVDAVTGLSAFQAEQVTSMSFSEDGTLNLDLLWEHKRKMIEQTQGLKVNREEYTFDDIGAQDALKLFLTRYFEGKKRPSCIVFIDEIEKAMAGDGDLSGISQDQLGQTLQYMQNKKATGLLFVGHPGGGKSANAKAVANQFGVPCIEFDYGAMKGGIVGESEHNMRKGLDVVDVVSGGNPLFIATSNDISQIKAELKARFKLGTYFFDLPSESERAQIWDIHTKKRGLEGMERPNDAGWVGREIENCCELADMLGISLVEAAKNIVPYSTSDAEKVDRLQGQAAGRWLDATHGGVYRKPEQRLSMAATGMNDAARQTALVDDE